MTVAPLAQGRSLLLIVAVIVAASVCAAATHTSRHALQGGAREPLLSSSEAVVSTAESDTAPGSGSDPAAAASPASQAQPLPSIDANGDAEGVVQPSSKTAHTAERQLELSWALLPLLRGTDSVVDVASQVPTDASRARPHASAPASSGDWQPPSARRERRGHDTNGTSPASHEDCERPLVLPVVVGVLALSALLASFFLCGRRHVGASLFEQTIRAERYAQVRYMRGAKAADRLFPLLIVVSLVVHDSVLPHFSWLCFRSPDSVLLFFSALSQCHCSSLLSLAYRMCVSLSLLPVFFIQSAFTLVISLSIPPSLPLV